VTVYYNTPNGPVIDLLATLKESLARVKAMLAAPCSICGADVPIDETRCSHCDRDPNTQHVKCGPCDGTGTIETSMYGGQYEGDVVKCDDCNGHGSHAAPCLEDREAFLATIANEAERE
jgi:hypothetical protein